ncbi:MAG: glycoside hydrolase family 140 protein, partial [Bacteroidales bacterium]|nr:glycoside hydrolase family 140 protein [Bacteroidales bacterium]
GNPFFWLGDTGWLLFTKLNREEAIVYLDNRAEKGFNVIQASLVHGISAKNSYGDSALLNRNIAMPVITEGSSFENEAEYDYWDHIDYVIRLAEERGLYMALIPVWGSNVRAGLVSREQAETYASYIANRYKTYSNIIWLNGGDVPGSDSTEVWNIIGETIQKTDPDHLVTFHPRGRMQSSMWFHDEEWLDFNMFQSGHRRYDQDDTELNYGEDNWRYAMADYNRVPVKPTIDGEPSYEGIPQGLHDPEEPYWTDNDVRRYAYWSVFAGCFGFTYGHNSIMQFYKPTDRRPAYGAKIYWTEALDAPGSSQLQHLKSLMLSRPYFERVPDQSLIAGDEGEKYHRLMATAGKNYAFVYTYNGRNISVSGGAIPSDSLTANWFNPRNGEMSLIGRYKNNDIPEFDPPGEITDGNDWVLVLDYHN